MLLFQTPDSLSNTALGFTKSGSDVIICSASCTNFGPQVDKAVHILKLFSIYYYFLLACSIKPHDFRFSDVNL